MVRVHTKYLISKLNLYFIPKMSHSLNTIFLTSIFPYLQTKFLFLFLHPLFHLTFFCLQGLILPIPVLHLPQVLPQAKVPLHLQKLSQMSQSQLLITIWEGLADHISFQLTLMIFFAITVLLSPSLMFLLPYPLLPMLFCPTFNPMLSLHHIQKPLKILTRFRL